MHSDNSHAATNAAVVAAWLESLRGVGAWGLLMFLSSVLFCAVLLDGSAIVGVFFAVALLLGIAERYFALRLSFDASLFSRVSRGEIATLDGLDHGLQAIGFFPKLSGNGESRSLSERIEGTRRLVKRYFALVFLQTVVFVVLCLIR